MIPEVIADIIYDTRKKIDELPETPKEETRKILDGMTAVELATLQQKQSFLHASGKMPLEVAQFIYSLIGEGCSVERWKQQHLADRCLAIGLLKQYE